MRAVHRAVLFYSETLQTKKPCFFHCIVESLALYSCEKLKILYLKYMYFYKRKYKMLLGALEEIVTVLFSPRI